MDIASVIFIVALIAIPIILFKIAKKAFKIFLLFASIIIIFFLISSVFLYLDFKDIRENAESPKIYLIEENKEVLGGIISGKSAVGLTQKQISDFSASLRTESYDKILGSRYRLFIIKTEAYDNIKEQIEFIEFSLTAEQALDILRSDKPAEELSIQLENNMVKNIDNTEIRSILSSQLIAVVIGNKIITLSEFKKRNVVIYPETAIFRLSRLIPADMFRSVAEKIS